MTGLRKLICVLLSAVMLCGNSGIVLADDSTQTALTNTGTSGGGGSSSGGIINEDVRAFTYVVDNMAFWQGDAEIEEPDSSCEVSVDMTKRKQSNDRDKLIIAAYSDTDKLIGMYTVVHDIEFGKTSNIKVSVNVPEGDVLGNVKAFVWDSFVGMRALSNTISRYNNREIDPMLEYDEEQQTSFIDVSKDSEYAYAIEFLATLGVLKGNSNGYFNPTGSVNRADAAAGISHIAGRDEEAYYLRGESIYTDTVPGDIFTGYLNLGYIEPVSPGVIAPYDNITTGEFIRAAVKALGYAETAEVLGGWPTGYISAAKSLGLLSGIKSNISDSLTREELAMLCLNTLNAPIMEIVGTDYTASGVVVPKKVKMDGTGANYYKSFLTETYGAYSVEGFVVETANSGTLNQGKVKFGIAKSENYNNIDLSNRSFGYANNVYNISDVLYDPSRIITVNTGKTNAADYEGLYAKAIIGYNENNDYALISFSPSGNNIVKVDSKQIDKEEYEDNSFSMRSENYIYIHSSDFETRYKYNLQKKDNGYLDVKIYVNGCAMDTDTDAKTRALIDAYVINAAVGDIELVDTYKTDGYYDTIYVNSYVTAQVDSVTASTKKIIFKDSTIGATVLTLDEDLNADLVYNIYYNGEKIALTDLKKDDVLSIAYNVGDGTKTAFANSDHYDIYVSRTVETGKLTEMSYSDEVVIIGGKKYSFIDSYTSATRDFFLGNTYTIYVDCFGRIYKSQMKITPSKYAVVDKFIYNSSDEDYRLTLFTAEGETKTLTFDSSKATVYADGLAVSGVSAKFEKQNYILDKVYTNGSSAAAGREPIEDRVVKYKVSTATGRVTEIDFLTASNSTVSSVDVTMANYKAATGAIGSVKVGDATKIIDAVRYCLNEDSNYTDLATATKDSLVNGERYRAYAYDDKIDGYHPFVLIAETTAELPEIPEPDDSAAETNYAVVDKFIYNSSDEDYRLIMFTADGETKTLTFDSSKATVYADGVAVSGVFTKAEKQNYILSKVYINGSSAAAGREPIEDRVVKYSISASTGRVIRLDFLTGIAGNGIYKSSTGVIGSVQVDDNTKMIDACRYIINSSESFTDLIASEKAALVENEEYIAYGYGDKVDGYHPFVLITETTAELPEIPEPDDSMAETNYAVVDKFIYNSSDEDYRLTLFTAEGETKTLTFDSSKAKVYEDGAAVSGVSTKAEKQNYILAKVYNNGSSAAAGRKSIEDRVVKYKVSTSSGRVTEIDFLTAANSTVSSVDVTKANYKAATGAIGSVKVGDATKIIDAIKYYSKDDADYTDLVISTKDSLEDGEPYRAYGYGEKVDGYHPFVLICEGPAPYNAKSRFAVIADSITTAIDDSDMYIYKIPAFYYKSGEDNNSVKQLIGNDELNETKVKALNVGDVIMFRLDANGYINDFDVIFSLSSDGVPEYDALVAKSIVEKNDTAFFTNGVIAFPNIDYCSDAWVKEWAGYSPTVTEPIQLVYGPVVTRSNNLFGVGKIAKESDGTLYTDLNKSERYDGGVYEIDIDSSTAVYEYDYSQSKKNRLSVGTAAAIRASSFFESNLVDNDYIPWNLEVDGETPNLESVNFAFALVVDGMAKDVLVFNAS